MAQTKKSWQDYFTGSFGEQGQARPQTNALEVGGRDSGGVFEPLPIGTSATGTAVLVDLIAGESVTVTVGSVGISAFTGTAGTATQVRLVSTAGGALTTSGTVTGVGTVAGIGVLALGTVTPTAPISATAGTTTIVASDTVTTGTAKIEVNGIIKQVVWVVPDMEDSDSTKLEISDEKGYEWFDSGTKAESATYIEGTSIQTYEIPLYGTTSLVFTAEGTQSTNRDIAWYVKYQRS